jgi:oligopeptide/dipeptide ABC transporter ATP-binding protein
MASILEVQDLHVSYRSRAGASCRALAGISFSLMPGEILGVLGESGSGKSTLGAALLRLLPCNANITRGAVRFEGQDILQATPRELQGIRGRRISLIYQEPSLALHPTMRAGEQVRQVLAAHAPSARRGLKVKAHQVLAALFPEETERISRSYPHQLSGGQRQRVLIAQAIACGPSLLVADEPTASLDPTTQMEILAVMRRLREQLGLAMILITHNPALLAELADRVLVLYGGLVAELGPVESVLSSPQHPYTRALFRSIPDLYERHPADGKRELPAIPAHWVDTSIPSCGCPFEPRCTERMDICRKSEPALVKLSDGHTVSCFKYEN